MLALLSGKSNNEEADDENTTKCKKREGDFNNLYLFSLFSTAPRHNVSFLTCCSKFGQWSHVPTNIYLRCTFLKP